MDIFAPLQLFADWLSFTVFGLAKTSLAGSALNFFIFDTIKISLLLAVIIFIVSYIRTFLPPEKTRKFLAGRSLLVSHNLATLIGVVTPFCSCSAVPLFLGFIEAGVPLGVTFTFLVSSPMVNEVALILLFGLFGWKITAIYIVSGLVIAIVSGLVIGRLKVEPLLESFVLKMSLSGNQSELPVLSRQERLTYAWGYVKEIVVKVYPYVIIGVGLGAWIHGYVPADFLARYAGADRWYAVPLVVLTGIPLYSNAAGVIPLVSALHEKGVAMGTVLAFMMAVTALSLPEFMILKKVMKVRLIVIFASVVGVGIMFIGYLFNWLIR
jgi:uncharacterized membrane protein YraQ (UPF0718 family)